MIIFLLDLVPLVGATLGAIIVGIITLFNDFPTDTIIWAIWSIVYQQVENNIIQPRIQARRCRCTRSWCSTSVLFGSTLFGVLGALLAIPVAAAIQISIIEYNRFRRRRSSGRGGQAPPPAADCRRRRRRRRRRRAGALVLVAAAARRRLGERGDAAAEHEAGHRGADQDLLAVLVDLLAPVGDLGDLGAQALDGQPELGAVGLDRAPDLLRRARWRPSALAPRRRRLARADRADGVPAGEAVSVPLISCASSIAICGVGGEPFLIEAHAREPGDRAEQQDQRRR